MESLSDDVRRLVTQTSGIFYVKWTQNKKYMYMQLCTSILPTNQNGENNWSYRKPNSENGAFFERIFCSFQQHSATAKNGQATVESTLGAQTSSLSHVHWKSRSIRPEYSKSTACEPFAVTPCDKYSNYKIYLMDMDSTKWKYTV